MKLPVRPTVPQRPSVFTMPNLDLGRTVGATVSLWKATASEQGNFATLSYAATNNGPADTYATRCGFLQATIDSAAPTTVSNFNNVGHVFGRLGQGNRTLPDNSKAFLWGSIADTNIPSMLISFFPAADADAGLDSASKFNTIEAKNVAWQTLSDLAAPALSDLPSAPNKDPRDGAVNFAVGLMASLALASSLF